MAFDPLSHLGETVKVAEGVGGLGGAVENGGDPFAGVVAAGPCGVTAMIGGDEYEVIGAEQGI